MNKKNLIVGIVLLCLVAGLSGCIDNENITNFDRLLGTWKTADEMTLILRSDGTCSFIGGSGTWELKDGKLFITINFNDGQNMMSYEYQFSDNYKTLTLTDAGDRMLIFTKQ